MDERARGIILRTRPLTDTSLIVHWLTSDLGRLSTVAKGARRSKSAFAGKLDLFYLADFSFQRSRRSELHTLREVALQETSTKLRHELQWLRQASYVAHLLEQTTETETPIPEFYELLRDFLHFLVQLPPQASPVLAFELRLLELLGLSINPTATSLTVGARQIMHHLTNLPWSSLIPLRLAPAQVKEISRFLQGHLAEHLGKVLPDRAAAVGANS